MLESLKTGYLPVVLKEPRRVSNSSLVVFLQLHTAGAAHGKVKPRTSPFALCHVLYEDHWGRVRASIKIWSHNLTGLSRALHWYHRGHGFEYRSSLNCSRLKDLWIHQITASVQIHNIFHKFTCRIFYQSKPSYFPTETKKPLISQELSCLLTGSCCHARHLIKVIHQSKFDETIFNAWSWR